ncbi:hypothetical protein [Salmonirosea aquatica]|uniref:Uncharacterized protein n=1 Tax=Salmonirosea aquatica TaxID=2654236 RepID=A0A7C9F347_9BACT|nr:hypothetical protein [Cytophagaceae bacterium SJW1-29]
MKIFVSILLLFSLFGNAIFAQSDQSFPPAKFLEIHHFVYKKKQSLGEILVSGEFRPGIYYYVYAQNFTIKKVIDSYPYGSEKRIFLEKQNGENWKKLKENAGTIVRKVKRDYPESVLKIFYFTKMVDASGASWENQLPYEVRDNLLLTMSGNGSYDCDLGFSVFDYDFVNYSSLDEKRGKVIDLMEKTCLD